MTQEKQAVKILADSLVKAMKSVSANTASKSVGNKKDQTTINASKIIGLPLAVSTTINNVESAAAEDPVASQTLAALNRIAAGEFKTIMADEANIGEIYATYGHFIQLVAENATIPGIADIGTIRSAMATIGLLKIDEAYIKAEHVVRSDTQEAFINTLEAGKVTIDDLVVTDANIANLTAGTIMLKDSDGDMLELYTDQVTQTVKTRKVSYSGNNLINDDSISGSKLENNSITTGKLANNSVTTNKLANNSVTTGKLNDNSVTTVKLADSSVTTSKLNTSEIFAASGTVMGLISDNINAVSKSMINTEIKTVTTNANGNGNLNISTTNNIVVSTYSTSNTGSYIVTAFRPANGATWYVHIVDAISQLAVSGQIGVSVTYINLTS